MGGGVNGRGVSEREGSECSEGERERERERGSA